MIIYNILLNLLFISLSFARGLIFENLERGVIPGQENIQSYTNDFEADGNMVLTLILANGKKYRLTEMLCHKEFGQFSWNPPDEIPVGSSGRFYYDVDINGDLHSGEGDEIIFVEKYNTVSSSTPTSSPSNSSEKTKESVPAKTTTAAKSNSVPTSYPIDNKNSSSSSGNENGNDNSKEEIISTSDTIVTEDTTGSEPIVPITSSNPSQVAGVDNKKSGDGEKSNGKYLLYIGGGGGLVVVAIAGFLIVNKFRSKKIDEYDFEDSKPFNASSPFNKDMNMKYPEMPNLLNGNLSPVNMYNSPKDTPVNNNGFDLYNNDGNKNSYGIPSIGSPKYSNSPKNNDYDNYNENFNDNYRDNYRESYRGDFNDNYRDPKRSIINLNGSPNDEFKIDVRPTMPPKINFVANPRCGSLPRNKLPNDFNPPMSEDGYNERSYRNSVLSFISSNRGSYYGAAQAEHTIKHFLLNKVCTVAYVLEPENEDELYLTVGDKVKILEVFDDGWAYSLQLDTGLEGMIPLNCTAEYYQ